MAESSAIRVGLGGAEIGNHRVALDETAAHALLEAAWSAGVRLFDTAPHYGLGLSERRLGTFLAGRVRDGFRVSTKVGRRLVAQDNPTGALDDEGFLVAADLRREWDFTEAGVRATVEDSLTRLGLDHVDVAYLHDPERCDLDAALASGLPALVRLREDGLVRSIGVGSMHVGALLAAARTGLVDELMVAGRHTLVDRSAERELLPLCSESGIEVVAAAVFNGGLLAEHPTAQSSFDYDAVPADVLARATTLERLCAEAGVPLAAAALQFPLRHPAVQRVVVGAVHPSQVEDNLRLLATPIPPALWHELEALDDPAQGASR